MRGKLMSDINKNNKKFKLGSNDNLEENSEETEGISTILLDPKKAILKFQTLIVAMILTSMNNFIDGIWIAGLGENALAAIGFITPGIMLLNGVSSGLSNGAISVISRFIGANNKKEADNAALHIILLVVFFSVIFLSLSLLFLEPVLLILGAGNTLEYGLHYGYILFGACIFPMFAIASYGILRAEGKVKKTIYAMSLVAILNMILDPLLIYILDFGIAGASLATVISWAIISLIIIYWFKRDTYIDLAFKNFKYSLKTLKNILTVSLPSGSEFIVIAILVGIVNIILVAVSGYQGVAVFSAGWNIVLLVFIILTPVSIAVIATVAAAFGAKKFENLPIIQNFSIKLGILISVIIAITIFILAPFIAQLFTYSPETAGLSGLITEFLRVTAIYYISIPLGSVATAIFLGVGKGFDSFMLIILRELSLAAFFAYIFAIPLGFGQYGVWWGLVIGCIIGNLIAFIWSKLYIKRIIPK